MTVSFRNAIVRYLSSTAPRLFTLSHMFILSDVLSLTPLSLSNSVRSCGAHQVFCAQVFMLLFASIITRSLLSGSQRCRFMHVRTCSCVSPASAWRACSVSDFNIVSKETLSLAQLSRYNNILNNVVTLINIIGYRLL